MNTIDLGSIPYNEETKIIRKTCNIYLKQLRRIFSKELGSARLFIKYNLHELNDYFSVECRFDDDDEIGMDYAINIEHNSPSNWDEEARKEL